MFAKVTPDNHLEPETDLLPGFETTLSVGEILRRSRVKAGYSLEQVEQGVCIRASQIQAMEDGRWESLPGRVYVFGFIRTYSEYLGLDGEKMVLLLKQQSGKHVAPKPLLITAEEEDLPLPDHRVVLLFVALFIGALLILNFLLGRGDEPDKNLDIPAVPAALTARLTAPSHVTEPEKASAPDVEGSTAEGGAVSPPAEPIHPIVLKAVQNVWLEIRDAQKTPIFSRVLNVGEEYWVPGDQAGLVMTLGNAGGLQIIVEGETLPFLGREGKVIRNLSLDVQSLKELFAKQSLKIAPKKSM
jgi:cytoskeleton protein RodZ